MTKTRNRDPVVRIAGIVAGVLTGIGLIVSFQILPGFLQVKNAPAGWQIIRLPGEVYLILMKNNTVRAGGKDRVFPVDRITGRNISPPISCRNFKKFKTKIKNVQL